jgi:hypothetical protein
VCLKAKELLPHGDFQTWLETNAGDRGYRTLARWMKLAKVSLVSLLAEANVKSLTDAYVATGILPEPEHKEGGGGGDKNKLPWHPLKFSTRIDDWTKEAAADFVYEFDRAAQFVRTLRMEFGL